jgi:8-hydroxy-5-deazaflavin:NADPH oxidoreductase
VAVNVVVVGAGNVGRALAAGLRRAGHAVALAVRDPGRVDPFDAKREGVPLVPSRNAAQRGDVIVLAVPWDAVVPAIEAVGPLDGKIVVDATNPLTEDFALAVGHTDSAGETIARLAKGAQVVKAFNTTGADNMRDSRYAGGRLAMPVAGDDAAAKRKVMKLAADLGFEPVDVGPLAMSRYLEPMAMVWIKLAISQGKGTNFGFSLLQR